MPDSVTKTPHRKPLDGETAAALTLYNTYLIADREQQAHERALRKAEKAKDEAAAAVRKLHDRKAPAAETATAETKYREAVEALQKLRDGDTDASQDAAENDDASTDASAEAAEDTANETGDAPAEGTDDAPEEDQQSPAGETPEEDTADDATADDAAEAETSDEDTVGDEAADED